MAFTAGITRPQSNSTGSSGQRQQSKIDRLVTVSDYDLSKASLTATDDKGIKYEIVVDPETVAKIDASHKKNNTDTSKSPYVGHKIDEKMKKSSPPGSKMIIQKSEILQKDNGNGYKKAQIQRIFKVSNPEPHKTFEAITSVVYRMDEGKKKVARGLFWEENGIDVNHPDADRLLNELKDKMDAASALSGTKIGEFSVSVPTYGFQLRALLKSEKPYYVDNSEMYTAVNFSIPFDWMNGPLDEQGNEIKSQAHIVTGEEMFGIIDQYIEYISGHELFKDQIKDMIIEVCPYKVAPASNNDDLLLTKGDPAKDIHADKNPLYQLSHRQSYADIENDPNGLITGKNAAVKAIVQLTADRLERIDGKPQDIPTNWINRIHANNIRGHVHAFIRTHNGLKVEPHESLKLIETMRNEQNAAPRPRAENNQGYTPAPAPQASAPVQSPAPAPVQRAAPVAPEASTPDDFDPFTTPVTTSAPVEQAAPAEAPRSGGLRFGQKKS